MSEGAQWSLMLPRALLDLATNLILLTRLRRGMVEGLRHLNLSQGITEEPEKTRAWVDGLLKVDGHTARS